VLNIWQAVKNFFAEGFGIVRMISSSLSDKADAWDWSIAEFEAQDRLHPPPSDAIVFTGSSSITFWKSLKQDMSPLPVINRGFGGSKIHQVAHYADRIVIPYRPRAVVLFAGTNDIAGSKPKTAQQVFDGYIAFVKAVHAALPQTPIYFISITPTPSRWQLWSIVQEANRLIQTYTKTDRRLHFIELTDAIIGPDGKPDRSLFRIDRLHPNEKGYAVWTRIIKPILQTDLSGD
jgi:lysophospholipase L1-like esterase